MSGMDYFSMCIKWFQDRVRKGNILGCQSLKCLPHLHACGAVLGASLLASTKLKNHLSVLRVFKYRNVFKNIFAFVVASF